MNYRRVISLLLFGCILIACKKKEKFSPSNSIAQSFKFESNYYFPNDGIENDIYFQQNGLKDGDKLRLINGKTEDKITLEIKEITTDKAKISLSKSFKSGEYSIAFVRGNSIQAAGKISLTIGNDVKQEADNHIVAHRGGSKEAGVPDNSLASLNYAISLGCYASECDIYITKDDSVVVCHSESGSDATFGSKIIYNSTYSELKSHKNLANGESLPLLQEYIEELLKSPFTKLWIDVKSIGENNSVNNNYSIRAGQRAAQIVKRLDAQNRVEYIVGRKDVLDGCMTAVNEESDLAYMNTAYTPQDFLDAGYTWANFNLDLAFYNDPDAIQSYKDAGIRVSVFNADSDSQMDFFLAQEMDAICTNYPKKLLNKVR